VPRRATHDEQVRQHFDDVGALQLTPNPDSQTLAGELIHDVDHAELASVAGPFLV
jgi:hypothetical protein